MDFEAQPLRSGAGPPSHIPAPIRPLDVDAVGSWALLPSEQPKTLPQRLRSAWRGATPSVRAGLISASLFCGVATAVLVFAGVATAVGFLSAAPSTVTFFVLGDWGREGSANQTAVAALMGRTAAALRPAFIVSTGDNFYPNGLNSTADPLFQRSFMDVYTAPGLQVPWFATLGNHDYGDGYEYCANDAAVPCLRSPAHQLGAALAARDPRWHCQRGYTRTALGGDLELFFVDTNPMVPSLRATSWAAYPGGLAEQDPDAGVRKLGARLAASTARWKFLVGHHPPRSNGHHGGAPEVAAALEPLAAAHGVQAMFSGHDHDLEHITPADRPGFNIFVSGGGSNCDRDFEHGAADAAFQHRYSGFVAVTVGRDSTAVAFYTLEGGAKPAYTATLAPSAP